VLLPAVRGAPSNAWIVAPGFSCREQIGQLSDRMALHPADVLAAGLRQQPSIRSEVPEWQRQPLTS
jgi:hypothetical protein